MHCNLTENEARVVLERLNEGRVQGSADQEIYARACAKLSAAMRSSPHQHKSWLVGQGMTPRQAASHVRHRFGVTA